MSHQCCRGGTAEDGHHRQEEHSTAQEDHHEVCHLIVTINIDIGIDNLQLSHRKDIKEMYCNSYEFYYHII